MGGRPVAASRWLGGQLSVYPMNVRGAEYCVDSVNGSDNNTGKDWDNAKATIAAAVLLCAANKGDHIWLAPGHYEDLADAQIDLATAGITIAGVPDAVGSDIPRIDFNHANSSVNLGADNIILRNIAFRPGITDVLIGVDIETLSTGCVVEECEFLEGENAADEFITAVDLKLGCDDTIVRRNTFRTKAAAAGCTLGVSLPAASARVEVTDNLFVGNYSTAAIGGAGICTEMLIEGNRMKVKDGEPGIELPGTATGIINGNRIESTGLANPDAAIVAADCSWFDNQVVVADGAAPELVGTATETAMPIGSVFWVFKQLISSNIIVAGVDVTGVAAGGEIAIEDWIVKTNGIGLAGGTNFELTTNNARGEVAAGFGVETVANLGALKTVDKAGATVTGQNTVLEVGKKVIAECTVAPCTGAGTIDVYLKCRRLAAGATLVAA